MAKVINFHDEGFQNADEELAFNQLKEQLPDTFTIIPNLSIIIQGTPMEIDLLVIGPQCVWVIETKSNVPPVKVTQHEYLVNGISRGGHPVKTTRKKAQRLSSKFEELSPDDSSPFFQHLALFFPAPESLDVSDELKPFVLLMNEAVQIMLNPHNIVPENFHFLFPVQTDQKALLLKMLELDSGPQVPSFNNGVYKSSSHVMTGDWKIWQAKHIVTNASVELHERQLVRMGMSFDDFQKAKRKVFYPAELGERLRFAPYFDPPKERIEHYETGLPILVIPQYSGKRLADHDTFTPDEAKSILLRVSKAVQLAHNQKIAFRTLDDEKISYNPLKILSTAFLHAHQIDQAATDVYATTPHSWALHLKEDWLAPEHQDGGVVSDAADRWFIGRLAKELFGDDLPEELRETVDALLNDLPDKRPSSLKTLIEILTTPTASTITPVTPKEELVVSDRYEFIEIISQEGLIEFWRGKDLVTNIEVGIKVFMDEDDSTPKMEYALLDQINLPGVVKVKDFEQVGNYPMIVMEWLDGDALSTRALGNELSESQVITIGCRILETLKSLHPRVEEVPSGVLDDEDEDSNLTKYDIDYSEGLAHHNLTLENIILVDDRGPVLVDFGLYDNEGQTFHSADPDYLPHQPQKGPSDPDADLYAVGSIMKRMLPNMDTSSSLWPVLEKATHYERDLRFPSTDFFMDALLVLDFEDVDLPPTPPDIVELIRKIWELVRLGECQEALDLCPPSFTEIRKRIVQICGEGPISPDGPLLTIDDGDYKLWAKGQHEGEASHTDGTILSNATVHNYVVEDGTGQFLELAVHSGKESADDPRKLIGIQVSDSFTSTPPLSMLSTGGGRIGSVKQTKNPLTVFELKLATTNQRDGQPDPIDNFDRSFVKANKDELDTGSNSDIQQILTQFGAVGFGTREEVIADESNRRNQYCFAVSEEEAPHCLAIAYLLTRVLPLHNQYYGLGD